MNKFTQLISDHGDSTLKRRAATIASTAEIAQSNILNNLKNTRAKLLLDIENLTDLAPDSTDSLRPGSKDWDAETWALTLQEKKEKLHFLDIQIEIAAGTYDEYFKESKKDSKDNK